MVPPEERRRKALWRKPGFLGDAGGEGAGPSAFLISFTLVGAVRGFDCSDLGLLGAFVPFTPSCSGPAEPAFEFEEENLELKLVIQEFRLPIEPGFESLELLVEAEEGIGAGAVGPSCADTELFR